MKKVSFLCLLIFLSVVLTACSNEYISITEDESNAIAQYCSYLLIKYDKNHRDDIRLLDQKKLKEEIAKREAEEAKKNSHNQPTPVPTEVPEEPTPTVTEEPTPPPDDPSVTEEPTEAPPEGVIVPDSDVTSIAEAGGITGFTVEYRKYGLTDSYTNEGEFYSFSAPEGKKLCVFEFGITNTGSSDARFDAISYGLAYKLVTQEGISHKSELSLFTDDIQFYDLTVKAGETSHATLIFYVSPDEVPLYLEIKGQKTYNLKLN